MSLQFIKSPEGKDEYVLLPIEAYNALKPQIEKALEKEYVPFSVEDYVSNPIALARIKANLTQEELAKLLDVSQAYISKVEGKDNVTPKMLQKVNNVLDGNKSKSKR